MPRRRVRVEPVRAYDGEVPPEFLSAADPAWETVDATLRWLAAQRLRMLHSGWPKDLEWGPETRRLVAATNWCEAHSADLSDLGMPANGAGFRRERLRALVVKFG